MKETKNNKKKIVIIAVAALVAAIVAAVAVFVLLIKPADINDAINEVTGVKYRIEDNVVYYDGDVDKSEEVVQYEEPESGDLIAHIHIKGYGEITVRFFPEQAPLAVDNFVTHVKEGYYDGLTFHRIMDDFMIQGGDPKGTGTGGECIWKNDASEDIAFEDEFSKYLIPMRGALCMANSGANTNGSQFFIVQNPDYNIEDVMGLRQLGVDSDLVAYYKENGGACWLYGAHTVFGQVIEGYDVLDKVAGVQTDSNDAPIEDVIIEKIELDVY